MVADGSPAVGMRLVDALAGVDMAGWQRDHHRDQLPCSDADDLAEDSLEEGHSCNHRQSTVHYHDAIPLEVGSAVGWRVPLESYFEVGRGADTRLGQETHRVVEVAAVPDGGCCCRHALDVVQEVAEAAIDHFVHSLLGSRMHCRRTSAPMTAMFDCWEDSSAVAAAVTALVLGRVQVEVRGDLVALQVDRACDLR